MREISFEMARHMGLIEVKSGALLSDNEFRAGRYYNLGEEPNERLYRKELQKAHIVKEVTFEGEILKVIH